MRSGLYFLFVVKILLHLVNFVEKTGTGWATSSWGRTKCQLLPLGGWEEAAELPPRPRRPGFLLKTPGALECSGSAGGYLCSTSAPNSPNGPECSQALTFELVGTFIHSLGMTQGSALRFCCMDAPSFTFAGFLRVLLAFAVLSSAIRMNLKKKKKPKGNPWKTAFSRKSRWVKKILPPTSQSCRTPVYRKSLS